MDVSRVGKVRVDMNADVGNFGFDLFRIDRDVV